MSSTSYYHVALSFLCTHGGFHHVYKVNDPLIPTWQWKWLPRIWFTVILNCDYLELILIQESTILFVGLWWLISLVAFVTWYQRLIAQNNQRGILFYVSPNPKHACIWRGPIMFVHLSNEESEWRGQWQWRLLWSYLLYRCNNLRGSFLVVSSSSHFPDEGKEEETTRKLVVLDN